MSGYLTLADVFEALIGVRPPGLERVVTATVVDSREAEPGALFLAFQGEQADGHDYVGDAFSRGGVAALVEHDVPDEGLPLDLRDPGVRLPDSWSLPLVLRVESTLQALQQLATFWRKSQPGLRVVGITGSVGKTTTKELTASVLARRYATIKSEASYNTEIGLPLTVLRLTGKHERAVLEMGMYDMGEIADLARIAQPQVGVVTIVRPVHVERAGSFERIAKAKRELIEALPPAPEGTAILNHDDDIVRGMAAATDARILTYGLSPRADLWADRIEGLGLQGIRFRLHHQGETIHVKLPLLGRHSVHTALRATAVGLVEGLSWEEIVGGLREVEASAQLRLFAVEGPQGATILDDTYNASPASTIAALNLLNELDGRKLAVLGDMLELGDYTREAHEKVGMRALDVADMLITVGELGQMIGKTAIRWGMSPEQVHMVSGNVAAIELLKRVVDKGDVVLVKGSRVLHMEEIVNALSKES